MRIDILGIDIAKNVFQLHGVNRVGKAVFKRRAMRDQLLEVIASVEACTIVMEACTGAFYWLARSRRLAIG
jgi:transposase